MMVPCPSTHPNAKSRSLRSTGARYILQHTPLRRTSFVYSWTRAPARRHACTCRPRSRPARGCWNCGPSAPRPLDLVSANIQHARRVAQRTASLVDDIVIDPTRFDDVEGWEQPDYHQFWLDVIDEFAAKVMFCDGWQFSTGCCIEFLRACTLGLPRRDENLNELSNDKGLPCWTTRSGGCSERDSRPTLSMTPLQCSTVARLSEALRSGERPLKDAGLEAIAQKGLNVARFISADPLGDVRFVRILPGGGRQATSLDEGIRDLFRSGATTVNVRCFRPDSDKGNPFDYGIASPSEALSIAEMRMADGFHVIVNETVRVDDGGVSGVSEGGIWEFSPNATPRVVETGNVCRLPSDLARGVLRTVYGTEPEIDDSAGLRVEFSIHPQSVGYSNTRTLIWELTEAADTFLAGPAIWPNPFSRHIGDKVFGLLIADALGLPVPYSMVLPRRLPPFTFGRETGSGLWWTRTAPAEPRPGLFSTVKGWTDVFDLLANEDPQGTDVSSVIYQESVRARHSGAAIPTAGGDDFVVEGVPGEGDRFMLGAEGPTPIPEHVRDHVIQLLRKASAAIGPVRVEWVHDGDQAWVVQMHMARGAHRTRGISCWHAGEWLDWVRSR